MRWCQALALSFVLTTSLAGEPKVTVQGRGPYHLDEYVVIDIEANDWSEVSCWSPNGSRDVEYVDGRQSHLRCFVVAKTTGDLVIQIGGHPVGSLPAPLQVTVPFVEPLVASSLDIASAFAAQKRAKRPRAVIRAVTPKTTYIAGEEVVIEWITTVPATPYGLQRVITDGRQFAWLNDNPLPQVPGVAWLSHYSDLTRRRTAVAGEFVAEDGMRKTSFIPDREGVYEIPAMQFQGIATGGGPEPVVERFVTWSNPLTITVTKPPPEAAGLPVGKFTLECSLGSRGYWPAFQANARGVGILGGVADPEFVIPMAETVVIRRNDPGEWSFEAHTRRPSITLPPVQIAFFNPETGQRETSQCHGGELTPSDYFTFRSLMGPEPKKERAPAFDPEKYRDYLYPYSIAASAFALGALFLLASAFRD